MFLEGDVCEQCDWRCLECSSEKECKQCRSGFMLNKEDDKCYQCKVRHCGKCDEDIGKCEQCKEGYDLKEGKCELVERKVSASTEMSFEEFKAKYGKKYKDEKEEERRRAVYESNQEAMQTLRQSRAYSVGVNHMTDLTEEEVNSRNGFNRGNRLNQKKTTRKPTMNNKLGSVPTTMNWTAEGKVTSVKDQGSCGSCWAFAALATAESVVVLNGWETVNVDLSEQYLVECTYESDCDGTYYVEYVMDEILGGVPRESAYPYDPFNTHAGICDADPKVHVADSNMFYYDLTDDEIIELLQEGTLAVVVAASGWSYYSSGIYEC